MKAIIKCATCGQVLGDIEKEEITDEDRALYQQMIDCDQGHQAAVLVIQDGT